MAASRPAGGASHSKKEEEKDMKKRIVSLLLTAAMVFGLCGPIGGLIPEAGATDASGEVSGVKWQLSGGTLTVSGNGSLLYGSPLPVGDPKGRV